MTVYGSQRDAFEGITATVGNPEWRRGVAVRCQDIDGRTLTHVTGAEWRGLCGQPIRPIAPRRIGDRWCGVCAALYRRAGEQSEPART